MKQNESAHFSITDGVVYTTYSDAAVYTRVHQLAEARLDEAYVDGLKTIIHLSKTPVTTQNTRNFQVQKETIIYYVSQLLQHAIDDSELRLKKLLIYVTICRDSTFNFACIINSVLFGLLHAGIPLKYMFCATNIFFGTVLHLVVLNPQNQDTLLLLLPFENDASMKSLPLSWCDCKRNAEEEINRLNIIIRTEVTNHMQKLYSRVLVNNLA